MFSWLKKKEPVKPETYGPEFSVTFHNDQGSWEESVNLLDVMSEVMAQSGVELTRKGDSLVDPKTGFEFRPEFLSLEPGEGSVSTCSVTTVIHPKICPDGIFEYQHAAGDDLAGSFRQGFEMWEQTDYATLKEAVLPKPDNLTHMEMKLPDGRVRRILLGPVAHYVEDEEAHLAGSKCSPDGDEHPFCPCCLFTNTLMAFKPLLDTDDFYALRMFASRDETGRAQADCRVNGHDDRKGMAELKKYINQWPQAGFEFRKQYVLIQSVK